MYSLKRGPQRKANAKAISGIEMDCWRFLVRTRRACSREHRNLFAITWRRQRRLLSLLWNALGQPVAVSLRISRSDFARDASGIAAVIAAAAMSVQAYCLRSAASHTVCGVSQGPKADEVVVTVQNDGVVCYSSARQVSLIVVPPARSAAAACLQLTLLTSRPDGVTYVVYALNTHMDRVILTDN